MRQPPQEERLAWRVDDFCRAFGIGRTSVYKLIKQGKLRSIRVAGRTLIPDASGRALLTGGHEAA